MKEERESGAAVAKQVLRAGEGDGGKEENGEGTRVTVQSDNNRNVLEPMGSPLKIVPNGPLEPLG